MGSNFIRFERMEFDATVSLLPCWRWRGAKPARPVRGFSLAFEIFWQRPTGGREAFFSPLFFLGVELCSKCGFPQDKVLGSLQPGEQRYFEGFADFSRGCPISFRYFSQVQKEGLRFKYIPCSRFASLLRKNKHDLFFRRAE